MLEYILVVVSTILCIYYTINYFLPARGKKATTTIPGVHPSDDNLGNLPDIQAAGSLYHYLSKLHGIHGPIVGWWLGPQYTVSIASPQLFKEHSAVFDRPAVTFEYLIPLIGKKSIQLVNGEAGRRRHTAYTKCYSPYAMGQYYANMQKLTGQLMRKWTDLPENSYIPLVDSMLQFTVRTMLQSSMGSYFNDDNIVAKLVVAYQNVFDEFDVRLSGKTALDSKEKEQQFEDDMAYVRQTVRNAIAYRREAPPASEYLVIDAAIEVTETEEELEDDLITVFVAGFHTTGYALSWGLYYLAQHQDIQEKLYEEIKRVVGDETLTPETYKQLTYLQQVFSEVLRCSILGTFATRVQDAESRLGGHIVPAGTPVFHALAVVFKDSTVYPDPDKFDPERFNAENTKARRSYSFEPFGFAGKRKCPGYRFSQVESAFILTEVLRLFRVDLVRGQKVETKFGLMTVPKEEIWITVTKRN